MRVDGPDVGFVRVALLTVVVQLGEVLLELALILTARRLILAILALLAGDSKVQFFNLQLEELFALLIGCVNSFLVRKTCLSLRIVNLLESFNMPLKSFIVDLDGVNLVV